MRFVMLVAYLFASAVAVHAFGWLHGLGAAVALWLLLPYPPDRTTSLLGALRSDLFE